MYPAKARLRRKPTPLPPSPTPIDLTISHQIGGLTWRPDPTIAVANTNVKGTLVCTFALTPHASVNGMVTYDRTEAALQRTELISWLSNTYTGHIVLANAAFANELTLVCAQRDLLERTRIALEMITQSLP